MSSYYFIIIWITLYSLFLYTSGYKKSEYVCGQYVSRYSFLIAFIGVIPLLYLTAYRENVGDTYAYINSFNNMPSALGDLLSYISTLEKDIGFYLLGAFIKIFITKNVNLYFFILAFIQLFLLVKIYRKYSCSYAISLFLFIMSTDYISWLYNGVRQFLAVTIVFACMPLILKKRYFLSILIVLLASRIHGSALLVLPFIFITQGKAWNKTTLSFIFITLILVLFINQFTDILDNLLQETQYKNVVSDWQGFEDDGTNLFRVLVYAVPTIFSVIGLKHIRKINDPVINLATNMSIVSTGLYILSMFTSGIFIGRLPIYFSLYNYILLPWEINTLFTKTSARMLTLLLIIFYLLFYLYSITTMGLV